MVLTPELSWAIFAGGVALFANGLAYMMFRIDKDRAVYGEWRVSERTLLFLALTGGWFGAKAAQRRFRHKTRKEPFRTQLNLIPVIWLLGGLAWWFRADLAQIARLIQQG